MHRIDGDNVGVSLPTPQAAGTPGYFKAEDQQPPTQVTGDWLNAVQEEIAFAIEESGMTLSKTDNDQLYKAIKSNGNRTFWRSRLYLPEFETGSNVIATKGLTSYRVGRSGTTYSHTSSLELDGEARGLKINAAKVRYQCVTGFDGTITNRKVSLWHRPTSGVATKIGETANLAVASSGAVQDETIVLSSNPVLARGETLYAQLVLDGGTSGSAGIVDVFGVDINYWGGFD